ncbi:MAG: hypothetical protein NTU97_04495 [Candidatus Magasanikbacteria bacterium]|nr:hypothetical protein [Candidatus Magasanikbacteria bacterium]
MRRAILIDVTQSNFLVLSLLADEIVVARKKFKGPHPDVLSSLDRFIKQNSLGLEKINNLVLLEGQGSFSGVRQAAAILNTIHLIKKTNIFGFDVRKFSSEPNITYPKNKR